MDMKETAELAAFRKSVREWVRANLPGDVNQPYNYRGRESDPIGPYSLPLQQLINSINHIRATDRLTV